MLMSIILLINYSLYLPNTYSMYVFFSHILYLMVILLFNILGLYILTVHRLD